MCLGIPMRVIRVDGLLARCEAKGVERDVNLLMLHGDDVKAGDFVMVHLGHAIQRMTPQDAQAAWDLYDEMLAGESL